MPNKFYFKRSHIIGLNAGPKAPSDVESILGGIGYKPLQVCVTPHKRKAMRGITYLIDFLKLYVKVKRRDIAFVQWPFYMTPRNVEIIYRVLKLRGTRVWLLVHDLEFIRQGDTHFKLDMKYFALAELLIVHSQEMKSCLVERGVEADKMRILTCFDYLTDGSVPKERRNSCEVVFAGNLGKSLFLRKIEVEGYVLNCYGNGAERMRENMVYKGTFQPNHTADLEGSWGLVWDGDSTETCGGSYGEYMKMNAPHKVSLYVVAELPIIIWREAAMAAYVEEKGIGITISSLDEIPGKIAAVSDEAYARMTERIRHEAELLRHGQHLLSCIGL